VSGHIAAVDGDAAAPAATDRAAGCLGDDRAAVDGDAAAITVACADSKAVCSVSAAARPKLGTDDAAVDGDAAALPEIAGRISVGGNVAILMRSADGGGAVLSSGADIAAVMMMIVPSFS